jgi:hypothetical protein
MTESIIKPPSPARIKAKQFIANLDVSTLEPAEWNDGTNNWVQGRKFTLPYTTPEQQQIADEVKAIVLSVASVPLTINSNSPEMSFSYTGEPLRTHSRDEFEVRIKEDILMALQRNVLEGARAK